MIINGRRLTQRLSIYIDIDITIFVELIEYRILNMRLYIAYIYYLRIINEPRRLIL